MSWYVAAILVLILSLALNLGLLAYAMYALLGILLVSRLMTRNWIDNLESLRECNRYEAAIGDVVAVVATIRNKGSWPIAWVLVEDLLPRSALIFKPPNLEVAGSRIQLFSILAGQQRSLLYQMKCNRRGYYQIGPLVLESGDLFGLHRRYRIGSTPSYLVVYPKIIPIEGYDIASRRPIGEVRMTYRLYEDPTRIAGVRRYEIGDPMNRVHWRATASTGLLHSKVYEPSTVAGATFLLNFHKDSHPAKDEPFRSDLAITATASLARAIYEMGQQVGLVTNGRDAVDRVSKHGYAYDLRSREAARKAAAMSDESDRLKPVIVPTRRGPEQFIQMRSALARLELSDGLSLAELVSESSCRMPRDATVIAVLACPTDEETIVLGNLVRMGFFVVAMLNLFDDYEYAQSAGKLLAQGVESRHLRDEASVSLIGRRMLFGAH